MKGKVEPYVLWPLAKRVKNWIADQSTAPDFTVLGFKNRKSWKITIFELIKSNLYFPITCSYNRHTTHGVKMPYHIRLRLRLGLNCTGKSLSEALLFAEHGENILCTKIVLNIRNNFCTQHILPRFELGIFMYWTCNSMYNLLSYCGLVDAKIRASDKDLPLTELKPHNCNSLPTQYLVLGTLKT